MSAMLMASCFWCKNKKSETLLPSIQSFNRHILKAHRGGELKIFRCGQDNCFSTCNDLKTLLKHLKMKHCLPSKQNATLSVKCVKNVKGSVAEKDDEMIIQDECGNSSADGDFVSDGGNESRNADLTTSSFKEMIYNVSECFVSKQYTKSFLPRNYVQGVINDITTLFSGPLSLLEEHVVKLLRSNSINSEDILQVEKLFECVENPFDGLHTEHRRLKVFTESELYIPPQTYEIGKRLKQKVNAAQVSTASYEQVTGQFIPLGKVLEAFFGNGRQSQYH